MSKVMMSETSESSNGNDGVLVHVIDAEVIHAIPTFASKPIDEEKNFCDSEPYFMQKVTPYHHASSPKYILFVFPVIFWT